VIRRLICSNVSASSRSYGRPAARFMAIRSSMCATRRSISTRPSGDRRERAIIHCFADPALDVREIPHSFARLGNSRPRSRRRSRTRGSSRRAAQGASGSGSSPRASRLRNARSNCARPVTAADNARRRATNVAGVRGRSGSPPVRIRSSRRLPRLACARMIAGDAAACNDVLTQRDRHAGRPRA